MMLRVLPILVTVRQVMEPVVAVSSDHTVSQALNQMIKAEVWSLLIERQGLPVGVVTDRDILIRCVARGRSPDKVNVEEIMSSPLITIETNKSAGEALHTMVEKHVRRLYIVDQGKIIGRVTQTGLSRNLLDVMIALSSVRQQL
jgi:CBS domain-containing protein